MSVLGTRSEVRRSARQNRMKKNALCRRLLLAATVVALYLPITWTGFSQIDTAPLLIEAKIPLGHVVGRIDHLAIDLKRHRLLVAELGNNSVSVVDLDAKAVVHRISGLSEPQGVAYVQSTDSLYIANGGDGSVRVFHGADYAPKGQISLDSDADNIRFDFVNRKLLVGYGNGALAVIDPESDRETSTFHLKAHPESFQIDFNKNRIFVNLPNARAIVMLDRATGKQEASWSMPYRANFAMVLDEGRQQILVPFRRPAKLVAISTATGALQAEIDTCADADDLFMDLKRRRIYVSCGNGYLEVFDASDRVPRRIAHTPTVEGARTSLFVPELDRFFVAVRARSRTAAAIWVYRPTPLQ
jgi:YVTN family beta-propeller protein